MLKKDLYGVMTAEAERINYLNMYNSLSDVSHVSIPLTDHGMTDLQTNVAYTSYSESESHDWLFDNGCSRYMTSQR